MQWLADSNDGAESIIVSTWQPGALAANEGAARLLARDLAEVGIPQPWRAFWPIIRDSDGKTLGFPGGRWIAQGEAELDYDGLVSN